MLRSVSRTSLLTRSVSGVMMQSYRPLSIEVTAAMVKKLRELSGAPLMDCKHALGHETVQGDLQKAMDWLRAKGISKVSSSNRETKEGLIGVLAHDASVTFVEVNCETDFVGMNQDFQKFVASVGESVSKKFGTSTHSNIAAADILALPLADKPASTVEQALGDIVASIRETIVIRRAATFTAPEPNGVLSTYVHNKVGVGMLPSHVQLGKAAGLVRLTAADAVDVSAVQQQLRDSVGRKLAMHVVAAKPLFLSPAEVPADFLEKEKAIFQEQSKEDAAKKKPDVVEKIIQGKINKRLSEVCLLGQNHVAEEGTPVVKKFLETVSAQNKAKVEIKDYALWNLNQA